MPVCVYEGRARERAGERASIVGRKYEKSRYGKSAGEGGREGEREERRECVEIDPFFHFSSRPPQTHAHTHARAHTHTHTHPGVGGADTGALANINP